ncbi:hypothetical protein OS493_011404 [Desmophyllum pertusum]|uniref:CARD domain-containing protein n=1 Tax=Desmophyllum pertusum TaxID=174260 RepID=A0A9X0CNB0_9CNID|nr:hypothetical protein OS493_011404 [Desmophyllum pertusum]
MDKKHRDILRRHWYSLRQDLEIEKLLPHLVKVLDQADDETVKAEGPGRGKMVDKLLEILPRKGPATFDNFVKALQKIQPFLADRLLQESGDSLFWRRCVCKDNRQDNLSVLGLCKHPLVGERNSFWRRCVCKDNLSVLGLCKHPLVGELKDEVDLILSKVAAFRQPPNISSMTICPLHRSNLGSGWSRGTNTRCRVPALLSNHGKTSKTWPKCDRGIGKSDSQKTGIFLQVGSGICATCRKTLKALTDEEHTSTIPSSGEIEMDLNVVEQMGNLTLLPKPGDAQSSSRNIRELPQMCHQLRLIVINDNSDKEKGCVKSYQRYCSFQQHLDCGKHKYALEHETFYDKAMILYATRLEHGAGVVPEVTDDMRVSSDANSEALPMGWALKSTTGIEVVTERNIQDLTNKVMETFAPQHPIMVDAHNCELVCQSKTGKVYNKEAARHLHLTGNGCIHHFRDAKTTICSATKGFCWQM